jgi:hypothetical protein
MKILLLGIVLSAGLLFGAKQKGKDFGWIESGQVIPQVAIGDNRWSMEFIVVSLEETAQVFTVTFVNGAGEPMQVPLEGKGDTAVWADSVPPLGVRSVRTGNTGPLRQGYARLESDELSGFAFYAVLTSSEPTGTRPPFRTFVPGMSRLESQQRLVFNNTEGNTTCAAIVSQAFTSLGEALVLVARDENGAEFQRMEMPDFGRDQQKAFCLPDALPMTANRRGVIDIFGGSHAAIGFTFDSQGKFHTEAPYITCCFDLQ